MAMTVIPRKKSFRLLQQFYYHSLITLFIQQNKEVVVVYYCCVERVWVKSESVWVQREREFEWKILCWCRESLLSERFYVDAERERVWMKDNVLLFCSFKSEVRLFWIQIFTAYDFLFRCKTWDLFLWWSLTVRVVETLAMKWQSELWKLTLWSDSEV